MSTEETLRERRVRAGLTQAELAARAGVSERTVSKTEHGIACSPGTARKLATALGLAGAAQARFVAGAAGGDQGNGISLAVAAATRTLPHDVATFTGREGELRQQTQTGQYAAAEASLARAEEVYLRDGGTSGHVSTVLSSRGELALAMADPGAALARHTSALKIAVKHSMTDEGARACAGIGRCLLLSGQDAAAADPLRRALEIYERLGSPAAAGVRALLR